MKSNNSNETWKELPKNCKGQVFFQDLFQNAVYSLTRLRVMPYSSITIHPHKNGCEWYLDEETGEVYFCPKGESHCFVNDTARIKSLLSVKMVME